MSAHEPNLMEHEYDGIREYDNPTPGWWHMLLWGSIAFSIVYALWYHFSVFSPSIPTRFEMAKNAAQEALFGELGTLEPDEGTILTMSVDEGWMAYASTIFVGNCAQCHNADGTGGTGPNLTDDAYLHIANAEDLYGIVSDGVVAKGMPAWGNRLDQNQRVLLASYLVQIRTGGDRGKGPEGDMIPPFPDPPAAEATDEPAEPAEG